MQFIDSIVIGIVEGFTEFLPISSTGHMIVAGRFLGVEQSETIKAFEVVIQFAAIVAVMIVYRERLGRKNISLWSKLLVAFLPIGAIGYLLRHEVKEFFDPVVVAWMFIVGGVIFLVVEFFYDDNKAHTESVELVTFRQAILIGFAQVFSLIPGTSRAGSTIIGGLLTGLDRKSSAEFSFLLAIPVMSAVSGYDLLKHYREFGGVDWAIYVAGFLTAFVVAYLTIKLFLAFLGRFTFVPFGLYRIVFGIFLLYLYHGSAAGQGV